VTNINNSGPAAPAAVEGDAARNPPQQRPPRALGADGRVLGGGRGATLLLELRPRHSVRLIPFPLTPWAPALPAASQGPASRSRRRRTFKPFRLTRMQHSPPPRSPTALFCRWDGAVRARGGGQEGGRPCQLEERCIGEFFMYTGWVFGTRPGANQPSILLPFHSLHRPLRKRPQVMDIGHLRVTSSILGQSVALSQVDREVGRQGEQGGQGGQGGPGGPGGQGGQGAAAAAARVRLSKRTPACADALGQLLPPTQSPPQEAHAVALYPFLPLILLLAPFHFCSLPSSPLLHYPLSLPSLALLCPIPPRRSVIPSHQVDAALSALNTAISEAPMARGTGMFAGAQDSKLFK
jgi:hypothetical protein